MHRLYVYLAGRDKRGVILLTVAKSPTPAFARLTDPRGLNLSQEWTSQVEGAIYENRMNFEPWVETARDYHDLREKMIARGYRDIPSSASARLKLASYASGPVANTSGFQKRRTMIAKPTRRPG